MTDPIFLDKMFLTFRTDTKFSDFGLEANRRAHAATEEKQAEIQLRFTAAVTAIYALEGTPNLHSKGYGFHEIHYTNKEVHMVWNYTLDRIDVFVHTL